MTGLAKVKQIYLNAFLERSSNPQYFVNRTSPEDLMRHYTFCHSIFQNMINWSYFRYLQHVRQLHTLPLSNTMVCLVHVLDLYIYTIKDSVLNFKIKYILYMYNTSLQFSLNLVSDNPWMRVFNIRKNCICGYASISQWGFMQTKHLYVLIHIWTKGEVDAPLNRFKPSSKIFLLTIPRRCFFCGSFMLFLSCFVMLSCTSVCWCLVVTCWERADLLALACDV